MIDSDTFVWIVDPDDQPALPSVVEDIDIYGLKDFSSLRVPIDQDELNSGLLLGPDICHNLCQGANIFDVIALSPNASQNASPPSDSSPTYASLFPPALSPDTSPNSVASTPWLRTPGAEPSLTNMTPADPLWGIVETEEASCSTTIHFLDQSGNSLEDIPSQVQDVTAEDIACSGIISNVSLPSILTATPRTPLSNTPPILVVSPPAGAPTSPRTEAVPLGQAHYASLPPSSPHTSQSWFGFSPVSYPRETGPCATSPSLSPLSTGSFSSQSPSASPNPSPLTSCSPLSPALSPVPLSNSDEEVEMTDSIAFTSTRVTSVNLRAKRNVVTLYDDASPSKIPRRSNAKNIDEEEWSPGSERAKRPRTMSSAQSTRQVTASIPNCLPDECMTSQSSGGHPDATHTTCQICGQGFTRTSDYIRHLENSSIHPETRKVWPCPHCDRVLGRKDALGRHIKTLHPGKSVFIAGGIPGSQLPELQEEPSLQRMEQRKMPSRRQPRKGRR